MNERELSTRHYSIKDVAFTGEHISNTLKAAFEDKTPRSWQEARLYRTIVELFTKDVEKIMGRRIAQQFLAACGSYDG